MSIPEGWAEFNDVNAIIRGRMVAASGTFSGTFSADNVEAVKEANIRGNAVSSYYGFDFGAGATRADFTIPEQKFAQYVELIVPLSITFWGENATDARGGKLYIYKNGTLVNREVISLTVGRTQKTPKSGTKYIEETFYLLQVSRFSDFNVNPNASTTYTIVCESTVMTGAYADGYVNLSLLGSIVVSARKR